jgi:hypothetical protein
MADSSKIADLLNLMVDPSGFTVDDNLDLIRDVSAEVLIRLRISE